MIRRIYVILKTFFLVWSIAIRVDKGDSLGSPILITEDNIIIDGATRVRIAKSLGVQIPAVRIGKVEYVNPLDLKESY